MQYYERCSRPVHLFNYFVSSNPAIVLAEPFGRIDASAWFTKPPAPAMMRACLGWRSFNAVSICWWVYLDFMEFWATAHSKLRYHTHPQKITSATANSTNGPRSGGFCGRRGSCMQKLLNRAANAHHSENFVHKEDACGLRSESNGLTTRYYSQVVPVKCDSTTHLPS